MHDPVTFLKDLRRWFILVQNLAQALPIDGRAREVVTDNCIYYQIKIGFEDKIDKEAR